jgi:hypothetical protein
MLAYAGEIDLCPQATGRHIEVASTDGRNPAPQIAQDEPPDVRQQAELASRFGECSPATRTLTVEPVDQGPERRWLRHRQDSSKCQRRAMGIVAVRNPAGRMAEDLDR